MASVPNLSSHSSKDEEMGKGNGNIVVSSDGNISDIDNSIKIDDEINKLITSLGLNDSKDKGNASSTFVGSTKRDDSYDAEFDSYEWDNNGNMEIIEENVSAIKRLEKRISELERGGVDVEERDKKYPEDAYSFICLNGPVKFGMPNEENWPLQKKKIFFLGILVFTIQVIFFSLLMMSVMSMKRGTSEENDNPDAEEKEGIMKTFATFIPANTQQIVKVTQVLSLMIYAGFPEDSVLDLVKAFRYYPKSELENHEPTRCIKLACILRGLQGIMAILAALILVMTSRTVIDIILNFTALNSISAIDDTTFALANEGVFGPAFKRESDYIKNKDLPVRVYRKTKHVIYWKVMGSIAVFFIAVFVLVVSAQRSTNIWITPTFRVQFEETLYKRFSGCFRIDGRSYDFNRFTYRGMSRNNNKTSFGYCRDERFWKFWDNDKYDTSDPCDENIDAIAHSIKTNDHDISTAFDFQWYFPVSNNQFKLFFFDSYNEDDLYCDLQLGDGICDTEFNRRGYNYDGGDCCSSTCDKPLCNKDGLTNVFGIANTAGDGYQECKNPDAHSIIIQINNMTSNRHEPFTITPENLFTDLYRNETKWRGETPVDPICDLVCNGKEVLSVFITKSMEKNSQIVKIEDGAKCTFTVRNETGTDMRIWEGLNWNDPIWYVDYTIFHQDEDVEMEILTQSSSEASIVNFQRIPKCYFDVLGDKAIISYAASSTSFGAIRWLMEDHTLNSDCEDQTFLERYALANVLINMNGLKLLSYDNQCSWKPSVSCIRGNADILAVRHNELEGSLPTEIALLSELRQFDIANNKIVSIPSEVGLLSKLEDIYMADNQLTSIPSEIGHLDKLVHLSFSKNSISMIPDEIFVLKDLFGLYGGTNRLQSIPTSIGLMSGLEELFIDGNYFSSLPTEIGLLTNMRKINLNSNQLTSLVTEFGLMERLISLQVRWNDIQIIPTEIGKMKALENLGLESNKNLSEIPTEIGLLQRLDTLAVNLCNLTSFPTEIGLLSKLTDLITWENKLASLPTEIGLLSKLKVFNIGQNNLSTIPTEIGLLTSLTSITLSDNTLSALPSEIGLVRNLEYLSLSRNKILKSIPSTFWSLNNMRVLYLPVNNISSISSEIGMMTNLKTLSLAENIISSIPSEIGMLTNLELLNLHGNIFTYNDVPDEVKELCFDDTVVCTFGG